MIDYAAPVARYKKIRQVGKQLNGALVRTLSRDMINEGGQKLGFLKNGTLVFDSEDEMSILMEYCLYYVFRDGQIALQRYLAESPPVEGSDESQVLKAFEAGRYSIFVAQKVIPGVGLEVRDMFRDDELLVLDMGLSQTAEPGICLATRLNCFGDFWATGGAAIPMSAESLERVKLRLSKLFGTQEPDWDRLSPQKQADFAAGIIRACLKSHDTSRIEYRDVGTFTGRPSAIQRTPAAPQLSSATSVGRNEPCPCGGGKKYKKCCGQ